MATRYLTTLRNAQLDAITNFVGNNAYLRIYSGARPTGVDGALSGNVLLAEFALAAPFAAAAASGVLNPTIPANVKAVADGKAAWFRIVKNDNSTVCLDGIVGTTGSDLNLSVVDIISGMELSITGWSITRGNA